MFLQISTSRFQVQVEYQDAKDQIQVPYLASKVQNRVQRFQIKFQTLGRTGLKFKVSPKDFQVPDRVSTSCLRLARTNGATGPATIRKQADQRTGPEDRSDCFWCAENNC